MISVGEDLMPDCGTRRIFADAVQPPAGTFAGLAMHPSPSRQCADRTCLSATEHSTMLSHA